MAPAGCGAGHDACVGRLDGGVFLSASRARIAVRIQDRRRRCRACAADDLFAVHGPAKGERGHRRKRHGTMRPDPTTRASTTNELAIATAEGVMFRLPLASPASRLYAMGLDTLIVLGLVNGIGLLVYWIFSKAPGWGVMVITLAEFAIGFLYGAVLEG